MAVKIQYGNNILHPTKLCHCLFFKTSSATKHTSGIKEKSLMGGLGYHPNVLNVRGYLQENQAIVMDLAGADIPVEVLIMCQRTVV